jgi:hypothetical protein
VVRWTLSTLAASATGEVHLNLKASTTTGARTALLLEAAWREQEPDSAQTSDTKAIYAVPVVSYALTTTTDPVTPGQVVEYKVTVANVAASSFVVFMFCS